MVLAVVVVAGAVAWAAAVVAAAAGAVTGSVAGASPSFAGVAATDVDAAAKIYAGVGMNFGVPPGATWTVCPGLLISVRSIP